MNVTGSDNGTAAPSRKIKWLQWAALVILVLVGFGVRMLNLYDPPLDFNPVRQLRSALIARAVYYDLDPKIDPQTRHLADSMATLESYEPPVIEQIVGLTYYLTGAERVWVGRIFSCLCWLIGGLALFGIARRYTSFWSAWVGLAFYLGLPFGIVASRAFQPDPWMVMWILLTTWMALRWSEKPGWKNSLLTAIFAGITILVKVTAGFFVGGVLVLLCLDTLGIKRLLRMPKVWVMVGLTLAPAVIYYLVLHGKDAASYVSYNTLDLIGMTLTSKFYAEWLGMINLLVGLGAFVAALMGVLLAKNRLRLALIGLWAGYVLFGLFWPFQYTTHDYYHLSLVPLVGLSLTPLIGFVLQKLGEQKRLWQIAGIVLIGCALGYQFWVGRSEVVAQNYNGEPAAWQKMGEAIPQNASFVALVSDYGFRLSYYGMRRAADYWPARNDLSMAQQRGSPALDVQAAFQDIIKGRNYFLVAALDDFDAQTELKKILTEHYPVYKQGDGYLLFDLQHPITTP
jgi:hypothetical protein